MAKRAIAFFWIIILGLVLGRMRRTANAAAQLSACPLADGRGQPSYDLLDRSGKQIWHAEWTWERAGNQWQQSYKLIVNNVPDAGAVLVSEDLEPVSSWREVGDKRTTPPTAAAPTAPVRSRSRQPLRTAQ